MGLLYLYRLQHTLGSPVLLIFVVKGKTTQAVYVQHNIVRCVYINIVAAVQVLNILSVCV
jgi:hypothetical protein